MVMYQNDHPIQWTPVYAGGKVWLQINFFFLLLQQSPPVGQGLLIHEVSRSHTTMHHSR